MRATAGWLRDVLGRRLGRTKSHLPVVVLVVGLNAPLMVLLLWRNVGGLDLTVLGGVYLLGVALGYYLLPILFAALVIGVVFHPWRRLALGALAVALALFQFYLLADGQVYDIFRFHIDWFWLSVVLEDFAGLGVPVSVLWAAGVAVLVLLAFEAGVLSVADRLRNRRMLIAAVPGIVVPAFVGSQAVHIVAYEKNDERITAITPHLPIYLPVHSHSNAERYGDRLALIDADTRLEVRGGGAALDYPLEELRCERGKSPNILILLLESWRFDAWGPDVSPNLATLASRSTVFERHFSSGNSTVAGIFGLFYGLYPTYWDAVKAQNARLHNPVLIDELQRRGYDFGIFAQSGFDRHKIEDTIFRDIEVVDSFEGESVVERDRSMTGELMDYLEARSRDEKPFFALGFYKLSHSPYPSGAVDSTFLPALDPGRALLGGSDDPEPYFNRYRNAIHYDDALIGGLLDRMNELGLLEETLVVVTTDHAESFNDNGANYWGHGSNFTQYQTRVPLIIHFPGRTPRRVHARTTHLDVPPTLLAGPLGCATDPGRYSDGIDLSGELPDERPMVIASYVNYAVIVGDDVYESRPLGLKSYKLNDVTREADPPDPATVREILAALGRF